VITEFRGGLGFAANACHGAAVEPFRLDQSERDIACQLLIVRQVHALSGTFSEKLFYLIAAGCECRGELFSGALDRGAARVAEARLVAQFVSARSALPLDGFPRPRHRIFMINPNRTFSIDPGRDDR
jgi:hypothetical protein